MNNNREKFVDLANKRVNRTLKCIKLIGNLSNRSNYQYTEQDVEKIFDALQGELKVCRNRFRNHGKENEKEFSLE
ncbi:MAG: hypothetical protein OXG62_10920 [Nitrospinae bacterium]|nr:hypothetical protein [Nitrospinota bacterium]